MSKNQQSVVHRAFNRRAFLGSSAAVLGGLLTKKLAFAELGLGQATPHPLLLAARRLAQSGTPPGHWDESKIQAWAEQVQTYADPFGRTTAELQRVLYAFELEFLQNPKQVDPTAALAYQNLAAQLGAKIIAPIELPRESHPFWLLGEHPFAGYQSQDKLPSNADFVIVGAGLTGSSAAYHLLKLHPHATILILDEGNPACQATGRNGGNFELMPENFMGTYEGLPAERLKFLKFLRPKADAELLEQEALKQASAIFKFCHRNSRRFTELVTRNHLECDFSPSGWLRIAVTHIEEQGLIGEVAFARKLGIDFELWSAEKIKATLKIPAKFGGRLAPRSGNYHPFKFVNTTLQVLLKNGVQLHTQTHVEALRPQGSGVLVKTSRGEIQAKRAILATNAFSSRLFSELAEIAPYQSQILNLEHVENPIQGMTITENQGDLYYNFPRSRQYTDAYGIKRGMAHVGGGLDRPVENVDLLPRSLEVLQEVKAAMDLRFPDTRGQPPSRVWTGPMGFTRDRLPLIGPLFRRGEECKEIIVAAGFNGYGGSYCVEAGYTAAQFASQGQAPTEFEAEVFAPKRFSLY